MTALTQIQKEIKSTLDEFQKLKSINSHVDEIDIKLKECYAMLKKYDKQLDKELKDIEKLEGLGVKSLFYKTLGNKEEQLEKERQEYLELSLKYKQYNKEVEIMEYERELLTKKLNDLDSITEKLASLKESRKLEILSNPNSELRNTFQEQLHQLDINHALSKELSEAIQEGIKAMKALDVIIQYLQKAGEWGRWDMYSKDRKAGYMKQQSIDLAVNNLPHAQHQLNIFVRELRDLGESKIVFNIENIQFDKLRDFFFDNLISDWIIQQRIQNTLSNIVSNKSHVKRIVLSLQTEHKSVNIKISDLNKGVDELLLN